MNSRWQQLDQKFSQLSLREKSLITLCILVVIVLLGHVFALEPLYKENQAMETKISTAKLANQTLESQMMVAMAKLNKDPDQDINIEYKSLVKESQELSTQLASIIENLISPSEMSQLLEQVLSGTQGLKLISLESLKAEPITGEKASKTYAGYFVHPVRLELTGSYFSVLKYLETLESLPVNYYWKSFNYQVEKYPNAKLVLEVYTLGTRQEFIGG